MNRTIRVLLGAALAATVAVLPTGAASAASAACTWQPSTLPLPAGAEVGSISATDHQGGYSGTVRNPDGSARAVWWKNGMITQYPPVSGAKVIQVSDQNRSGTIVGNEMLIPNPRIRPLAASTRTGRWERLPALPETRGSEATGINDRGDIVGQIHKTNGGTVPVMWPANRPNEVIEIPGLPSGSYVRGIDEDGTILVETRDPGAGGQYHAALLRNGQLTRLFDLPGSNGSQGLDISNGRVVGWTEVRSAGGWLEEAGVLWARNSGPFPVPILLPSKLPNSKQAIGINRSGLIIGETGTATNLQPSVWRLRNFDASLSAGNHFNVVSDDGSIGGYRGSSPTVWRCG